MTTVNIYNFTSFKIALCGGGRDNPTTTVFVPRTPIDLNTIYRSSIDKKTKTDETILGVAVNSMPSFQDLLLPPTDGFIIVDKAIFDRMPDVSNIYTPDDSDKIVSGKDTITYIYSLLRKQNKPL
jgi:hypothetical protein